MNALHEEAFDTDKFDATLRAAHAAALANVSPPTLQRLRGARHAATQAHAPRPRWWLSATVPAVLAIAIGLPWLNGRVTHAPAAHAVAPAAVTGNNDDYTATLDENPDLYLWMASDGKQLAME